ncbi:hypothetical protein BCR42DRAFT_395279 [Absidia repens]|uniref:Uncharacterized protein n=1 Tax=Absidia repens TaxID=90262 RepID=A0A1X2I8K7_9FUNG|nr:hypothetical protein BCR42DRAFT_395279 [Absidia repens]
MNASIERNSLWISVILRYNRQAIQAKALVDSRATVSFIDSLLVKQFGLPSFSDRIIYDVGYLIMIGVNTIGTKIIGLVLKWINDSLVPEFIQMPLCLLFRQNIFIHDTTLGIVRGLLHFRGFSEASEDFQRIFRGISEDFSETVPYHLYCITVIFQLEKSILIKEYGRGCQALTLSLQIYSTE